ncbi:26S protease regulatory subunit 8, variant 2 [Perkinsus olseni]|uniref:26S protease regulatory subunit 8, variant 2 n=1 Tax=Perkinsus olseni TaxID=32597 RepID=A0A7J6P2F3_PEROL|nr:26S protease regulatory subunit 8, variant 2 [Perkinsus olseni]
MASATVDDIKMNDTSEGSSSRVKSYMGSKVEALEAIIREKQQNVNRLEAQRNELNTSVRQLREELQLLLEPCSSVGEVVKPMGKNRVLVKSGSEGKYVVDVDKSIDITKCTPTTRVALRSDTYTLHKLLPSKVDPLVSLMKVEKVPDSTYEMVGGLDKQIKEVKEVIELPIKHPEIFESLGIAQPKGVLLYGPPGTGKTLLARAVAHHTDCTFIRVSGSELVQKYIGEGSRMVRELFVMAREHAPSIIFMDEIDSIGGQRVEGESGGDSEVQRTMLELLNQLDGFEASTNIKVIMCTNRIDILDDALLRPGRIDRKIEFPNPNEEILKIHSRKMNLMRGINLRKIAAQMNGASGAESKEAGMFALRERRQHVTQEDFEMAVAKVMHKDADKNMSLKQLFKENGSAAMGSGGGGSGCKATATEVPASEDDLTAWCMQFVQLVQQEDGGGIRRHLAQAKSRLGGCLNRADSGIQRTVTGLLVRQGAQMGMWGKFLQPYMLHLKARRNHDWALALEHLVSAVRAYTELYVNSELLSSVEESSEDLQDVYFTSEDSFAWFVPPFIEVTSQTRHLAISMDDASDQNRWCMKLVEVARELFPKLLKERRRKMTGACWLSSELLRLFQRLDQVALCGPILASIEQQYKAYFTPEALPKSVAVTLYQICLEHNTDDYVKAGTYMVMEKLLLVLYRNLAKRVYSMVDPASCAYKMDLDYFEIAWQVASTKPSEVADSQSVASSSPMSVESEEHQLHRPDADEVQCALAGLIYIQAIKGYLSYEHKKFVFSKQNAFPPIDKWKWAICFGLPPSNCLCIVSLLGALKALVILTYVITSPSSQVEDLASPLGEVAHAGSPAAPSARRYAEVNPVITDLEAGLSPTGTDSTQTSGVEVMGSISSVSKVLPDMMEHLRSHTSPESSADLECAICLEGYAAISDEFPKAWVARLRFDSYAELGVHRHSSDKEVREAYLKAVKQHHPDAGGDHDKFVRVQQAYERINKEKKDGGGPKSTNGASSASSSSSSYSYPNSGAGFGSGGFGGATWWWSSGRPKGEDFAFDEREFEKAWSKFKRTQRRQGNSRWAQYQSDTDEEEDYFDEKYEPSRPQSPKATAGHSIVDISTSHTYHSGLLNGTYKRIGIFNGRPAYRRMSGNERWPVFLYYSERFNDWKLHSQLRDTNLCYAFLDDPECSNAFDLTKSSEPWFVFNDRKHRYEILSDMKLTLPNRAGSSAAAESGPEATAEELGAVSSWSATQLKRWLEDSGMGSKAELCFEKSDLVSAVQELMRSGVRPKKGSKSWSDKENSDAPRDRFVDDREADEEVEKKGGNDDEDLSLLDMTKMKGREVKLASRMKSDGKNIKPPRLQTSYHAFGNRVEFAYTSGQPVEEFLTTHGDRGRLYGVFVDGQYKFSVIWDRKERPMGPCEFSTHYPAADGIRLVEEKTDIGMDDGQANAAVLMSGWALRLQNPPYSALSFIMMAPLSSPSLSPQGCLALMAAEGLFLLVLQFDTKHFSDFAARKMCHSLSGLMMLFLPPQYLLCRLYVYAVVIVGLVMTWQLVPALPKWRFGDYGDIGITVYLIIVG